MGRGGRRGGCCCARRCCCCCCCRRCCCRCCGRAGSCRAPRGWPRWHNMLAPLRLQRRERLRWRKRALDRRGGREGCGRGALSPSLLGALRPFHLVLLLARRAPFHLLLLLDRGCITRAGAGRRGRCGHRVLDANAAAWRARCQRCRGAGRCQEGGCFQILLKGFLQNRRGSGAQQAWRPTRVVDWRTWFGRGSVRGRVGIHAGHVFGSTAAVTVAVRPRGTSRSMFNAVSAFQQLRQQQPGLFVNNN